MVDDASRRKSYDPQNPLFYFSLITAKKNVSQERHSATKNIIPHGSGENGLKQYYGAYLLWRMWRVGGPELTGEWEIPGAEFAEVPFGLEGVGSEAQEHSRGEHEGLEHYGVVIKRHLKEKNVGLIAVYWMCELTFDVAKNVPAVATDNDSSSVYKNIIHRLYTL